MVGIVILTPHRIIIPQMHSVTLYEPPGSRSRAVWGLRVYGAQSSGLKQVGRGWMDGGEPSCMESQILVVAPLSGPPL